MSYPMSIFGTQYEIFPEDQIGLAIENAQSQVENEEKNTVLVQRSCKGCNTTMYGDPLKQSDWVDYCEHCYPSTD